MHYVRVTRTNYRGYVEFQYAIDDPTLYLEMILPQTAFAEFCAQHEVVFLNAAQGEQIDRDRRKWYDGSAAVAVGD